MRDSSKSTKDGVTNMSQNFASYVDARWDVKEGESLRDVKEPVLVCRVELAFRYLYLTGRIIVPLCSS